MRRLLVIALVMLIFLPGIGIAQELPAVELRMVVVLSDAEDPNRYAAALAEATTANLSDSENSYIDVVGREDRLRDELMLEELVALSNVALFEYVGDPDAQVGWVDVQLLPFVGGRGGGRGGRGGFGRGGRGLPTSWGINLVREPVTEGSGLPSMIGTWLAQKVAALLESFMSGGELVPVTLTIKTDPVLANYKFGIASPSFTDGNGFGIWYGAKRPGSHELRVWRSPFPECVRDITVASGRGDDFIRVRVQLQREPDPCLFFLGR